jgi:glycosyltransferase involved in cell wall biosynthesis
MHSLEKKPKGKDKEFKPEISLIVVACKLHREIPRTLLSLSASYQHYISADDYEILVIDNGSTPPLHQSLIAGLAGNFRLIRIDPAPPSPAQAINLGMAEARGKIIGVMIDGARIVTPGLLHFARHGANLYENTIVSTLGWYLGRDFQRRAMISGYDKVRENALLDSINWPEDGYRLFEIGALDESCVDGWFYPLQESNAFFMHRHMWNMIGEFDERFSDTGGGFLNLDMYRRAVEIPGAEVVILLGEGTFHQLHGGEATNVTDEQLQEKVLKWQAQYTEIRGEPFKVAIPRHKPTYLGVLPRPALLRFARAALEPIWPSAHGMEPPLGNNFDRTLWTTAPIQFPPDPKIAEVFELMHNEFRANRFQTAAAIANVLRAYAPDEPEPQRILSLIGPLLTSLRVESGVENHSALAKAYQILGDNEKALAVHRNIRALKGRPLITTARRIKNMLKKIRRWLPKLGRNVASLILRNKPRFSSTTPPPQASLIKNSAGLPYILKQIHVEDARLFADRIEMLKSFSSRQGLTIAEIGVAYGDFSESILNILNPKSFHAYDLFQFHNVPVIWGEKTENTLKGLSHRSFYEKRFAKEIDAGQVHVFEGDSATEMEKQEDSTYDIIYIDGDHHYNGVYKDAMVSMRKLKPDGILIFNDYIYFDHIAGYHYGIIQVVNDLCVNHGWKITHFAFHQQMFCDIVIQRQ